MNPLFKLSLFLSLIALSYPQNIDYDCFAFAVQWMSKHSFVPLPHSTSYRQLLCRRRMLA